QACSARPASARPTPTSPPPRPRGPATRRSPPPSVRRGARHRRRPPFQPHPVNVPGLPRTASSLPRSPPAGPATPRVALLARRFSVKLAKPLVLMSQQARVDQQRGSPGATPVTAAKAALGAILAGTLTAWRRRATG